MTSSVMVNAGFPRTITSAAGVIAQLEETDKLLKTEALTQLNAVLDHFWAEVAENLEQIELLAEDETFPGRKMANLVLSKVSYHLELYDQALNYALGAEELFKLSDRTEFVEKIVTQCIDKYITHKNALDQKQQTGGEAGGDVDGSVCLDARLLDIVERMFARCKKEQEWYHGLGIAIECKRLDKVEDFVLSSPFLFDMIDYCQKNLRNPAVGSREFRMQLVKLLIDIYKKQGLNSSSSSQQSSSGNKIKFITKLLQCYFFASDVKSTKELLVMLVRRELDLDLDDPDAMQVDDKKAEGRNKNLLLLYQLAFDIVENENQQFCRELVGMLKAERDMIVGKKPEDVEAEQAAKAEGGDKPEGEEGDASGEAAAPKTSYPPYDMQKDDEMTLLLSILSGLKRLELNLEFLFKNNRSDLLILDRAKKTCEANKSSSVLHSGHMFMHAFMQAGTSSDIFLRQNLDWMSKAVMWAKFATTASLGVVHRGHIKESRNILSAYLPREGQQAGQGGSFYAEGGALFAMGLVHGNFYEPEIEAYLLQQLRQGQGSEVLSHGACLGLGLSSMGTQNSEIVDEMKQALYTDNAVTGEAAAYGMGLVMCGSASEKEIKELLQYAQDTQHEKIIRGCAVALALIMFQKEESADPLVEQLLLEKDPILRYGGCFVIGMAYCGTACTRAIQKLLSLSVSDVNDDVRRAAGMALGFVMCNVPQRVPEMVKLLANSYNPHVRYAAAMALGISSAGSANADAEEILRPLLTDNSDFVRQGAYVSLALLFMQSVSEGAEKFRADITRAIGDKHEDSITRFGALLAQGIIDAGGRNVCASFFAKSGGVRQGAAVGFLLFTQMWYWFPLIHGLSLAFNPTALIGLNKGLKMPKAFSFKSDVREQTKVKQSAFEYPAPEETKKAEETVKTKAVLSTAAKKGKGIKAGVSTDKAATPSSTTEAEKKKVPSKGEGDAPKKVAAMAKMFDDVEKMDVDEEGAKDKAGDSAAASTDKEKKDSDKAAKKKLPALMTLHNPSRVVPAQEKFIKFDLGSGISPPATSQAPSSPKQAPASGSSTAGATTTTSSGPVRYVPLLGNERQSGFLLLEDRNPGEPEEFVEASKAIEDPEPSPPEPFEWVEGVDN